MILLDTQALVWLVDGREDLGDTSRSLARASVSIGEAGVSAITFWELALQMIKGRITIEQPADLWRQQVLALGILEVPVSGAIGIMAAELQAFHKDPADRIITATALSLGATLITSDRRILGWQGNLARQDARA